VRFTTAVNVTGTPLLALSIGGATVQASYAFGSGTNALVFTYTIEPAQTDTNGISIAANSLSLNGGSINDASNSTAAVLNHSAVGDNSGFLVDTTAPAAGTLAFSGLVDTGSANTPPITTDNSFDLSLSGNEIGSTVIYQVSTAAGINWATTSSNLSGFADASYLFRALVSDAAGNSNSSNTISVTVLTTAPSVPGLTLSSDTGSSSTDRLTSSGNITVSGGDNTATWQFSSNAGVTWSAPQAAVTTSFTVAEGSYGAGQVQVRQSDAAGNTSNANAAFQAFTVDTTGPTVSSFALSDSALQGGDTSTVSLVFSEAVAGFSSDAAITAANGVLSAMTSADNITWTGVFTPTPNIQDATNTLALANSYTDAAGNAGVAASTTNYSIATRALAAPTLKPLNGSVTSSGEWVTLVQPGEAAVVKVEGLASGATFDYSNDNGQTWIQGQGDSFSIASVGSTKRLSLLARQRDQAGTLGPASAVLNLNFFLIEAVATKAESFLIKPILPEALETIRQSTSSASKIQTFALEYGVSPEANRGQSALILDSILLQDTAGSSGTYGVGFIGMDPSTGAASESLTYDPSKSGGATAYDLDGDGTFDHIRLRLVDGGLGDGDPTSALIKGSISAIRESINAGFSSIGNQDLQVVDPRLPRANVAVNLTATLVSRDATVNEIGFVVVDSGVPITLDLIRERGNVLFSGLESSGLPDLSALELNSKIALRNGQTLRFYETVDSSFADLSRGKTSLSELGSAFRFLDVSLDSSTATAKVRSPGGLGFNLSLSAAPPSLAELIADRQMEAPVLDFTFNPKANQTVKADWTLVREASYSPILSFYRIQNLDGSVLDPLTGALVNPSDPAYREAATRNRVEQLSGLTVGNLQSTSGRVNLNESSLLAPMAVVSAPEYQETFFAFAAANTDKLGHFRRLGDNIFGLEDLRGGGDLDFDDHIFSFTPISTL
jgi:hypothetical protein